jgi:hypothetical protein
MQSRASGLRGPTFSCKALFSSRRFRAPLPYTTPYPSVGLNASATGPACIQLGLPTASEVSLWPWLSPFRILAADQIVFKGCYGRR